MRFELAGMRLKNPMNNSQGFSRNATFAAARERKQQRMRAYWMTIQMLQRAGFTPLGVTMRGLEVTITRCSPGTLDDDAVPPSCKSVRDGIADGLGVNDRDPRVRWTYRQEKCKRGQYSVRVAITERSLREEGAA